MEAALVLALLITPSTAPRQARAEARLRIAEPAELEASADPLTFVLEGYVSEPDGTPAEGAVVASAAGGKAVTDADGWYRLEILVPEDAEQVQLTAVGRGGRASLASRSVALSGLPGSVPVGPLLLASGGGCSPSWLPTFGGSQGVGGSVYALAVFDDGSGSALYVGGTFTAAGGVAANRVARWDGSSWSALGSGVENGVIGTDVLSLTVFDDGGGPALYAGGNFTTAGGDAASRVAKWDGSSWSALGSGVGGTQFHWVHALCVFDDGSGPALYAGGNFITMGGVTANGIAKWDGSSWSALGSGIAGGSHTTHVRALAVFDDGGGPALHAGGDFTTAGGVVVNDIGKWDGSSWSAVGSGISGGQYPTVNALTVLDDGAGTALYAGGRFAAAGGTPASGIAKWDGSSWAALGSGMNGTLLSLTVFDGALHAAGFMSWAGGPTKHAVVKWDGTGWSMLGNGLYGTVNVLTEFDDGGGPELYVGGSFNRALNDPVDTQANFIVSWNGSSWSALGDGISATVSAIAAFDDGDGPALYAGGAFKTANSVVVNRIARWDGSSWEPLGEGMGPSSSAVNALTVFDDGTGTALYAGGYFTTAGSVAVNQIARWDGSSWSALGSGVAGGTSTAVHALAVFDDGGGPALYAGGDFTSAGGVAASRIAKWDGAGWSALGGGMNHFVTALTVFDDGNGAALYAGGWFATAGGLTVNRIARWNGSTWAALGSGVTGSGPSRVNALSVFDDGGGSMLYAGGNFTTAGGITANRIARWNGSSWSALGSGTNNEVSSLTVFDHGSGAALFAGGLFATAGGMAANRIACWDGSSWSALGSGMDGPVYALTVFDDGAGPALYGGGSFSTAYDSGDGRLAMWGCDTTAPVLSCADRTVIDRAANGAGEIVTLSAAVDDDHDLDPDLTFVPASGSLFPPGMTLVTCTATDDSGNQASCQFEVTVLEKFQARPR